MFDQPRSQNNVIPLSPDGAGGSVSVVLTRLPAAMHSLREKARQQLHNLLREFFDKVDDAMFELADKATNNHEQNVYFDAMREVRLERKTIESTFFRSIDIRFAQLLDHTLYNNEPAGKSTDKEFSLEELTLVKNDDLEELVAVEAMINKANEQFSEAIQHLTLRIDHLVPVKVYQKNNPIGADVICHAFNDAATSLGIDVKAKLVLFKLFDNIVMAKLGALFKILNQLLIDANIMPSLQSGTRVKRPSLPLATDYYGAGISADYPESQAAGNTSGAGASPGQSGGYQAPQYDEQTNQVLHALRDLLGARSSAGAGAPMQMQQHSGQEVASQELVRMLSLAQHQNNFSAHVSHAGGAIAPLNVRELLQTLLTSSSPDKQPQQINQVDDDVINLVSMMFDFILDDRNLAAPMKALIGRLQIPMVKVAIADKSFFSKGGHPARRLLNEMAMAALGWQEAGEDNQRKDSLYHKMETTVQTILSDFEFDMGIFSTLLRDFRDFLEKDKRRAKILEQRTVDAEAGMAKSDQARAQVDSVLGRIIADHDLPEAAKKLLMDAWSNVLFITALKHGVESDDWQAAIRTAQQLVWSLTAPLVKENRQAFLKLVPELLQKLRKGLDDIAYSSFEATQLFKQLEVLHIGRLKVAPKAEDAGVAEQEPVSAAANTAKVFVVAVDQALGALQSNAELEPPKIIDAEQDRLITSDVTQAEGVVDELTESNSQAATTVSDENSTPEASSLESLETIALDVAEQNEPDSLPEDDQHLALVGNITQGSWFEMQSDDGQKFRCRLAAIIRSSGKYIFVNRSGMKVAEESRMTLALALKSGRLRVLDDGMLFDRALEAVIGNLRGNR